MRFERSGGPSPEALLRTEADYSGESLKPCPVGLRSQAIPPPLDRQVRSSAHTLMMGDGAGRRQRNARPPAATSFLPAPMPLEGHSYRQPDCAEPSIGVAQVPAHPRWRPPI